MSRREGAERAPAVDEVSKGTKGPWGRLGPELAGIVVPFALIVYLALRGGGYDEVVRSEVGIAVWLVVGIAALAGLLPVSRPSRPGLAALALLSALTVWTAASLLWTESMENTFTELARVATYLGIFLYALLVQGPGSARRMLVAVAAAIGVVALLAVLSRFHPSWFPTDEYVQAFPAEQSRLNYPLNYPNGLAALMALGAPLLAVLAAGARSLAARAVATAALPVVGLAAFLTFSRSGLAIGAIGLVVLVVAHPRRRELVPALGVAALGTALLVFALTRRDALKDGLDSELAQQQGDEMLAVTLAVLAGVAALRIGLELAAQRSLKPRLRLPPTSRNQKIGVAAGLALVAMVGFVALGGPSELSQRWEEFKDPQATTGSTGRLTAAGGNGRYQYWESALDAFGSEPLTGIGPGAYEYWWARNGSLPNAIRNAHSLYFETLGELGLLGIVIVVGFLGLVVVNGVQGTRRRPDRDPDLLAGALAAAIVFAVAAANDWLWELPAVPVAFLFVAATLVSWRSESDAGAISLPGGVVTRRLAVAFAAVALLAVLAVSLVGSRLMSDAQSATESRDYEEAAEAARAAQDVQPFSATPYVDEAMALYKQGQSDPTQTARTTPGARSAAYEATEKEPTNWRTWYTVWAIERGTGRPAEAEAAYERLYSLNPRSGLFAPPEDAEDVRRLSEPAS